MIDPTADDFYIHWTNEPLYKYFQHFLYLMLGSHCRAIYYEMARLTIRSWA